MASTPKSKPHDEPDTADTATDPEAVLETLVRGHADGPVTFTRPGIESRTFTVKGGKVSTTKEGQDWLLRHVAGTAPAAE